MALSGSDQAYLQARSGIARSGASRSNAIWPLYGVITVDGVDLTAGLRYGSLHVTMALNEQPDTASFAVMLTDPGVDEAIVVGADVLIGLGGATANLLFGGRVLTTQDTVGPARTPRVRSVMCADYLQVLDSEYLVTYDWPPQSATVTILDLIARFANKAGGVQISTAGVRAALPSHASVGALNERVSTVLRRLVTMFPEGGGFYVDPLRVLHVWAGVSEPGVLNPQPLTLELATLKQFAASVDGSQQRDAVMVEGRRTVAPIGTPGPRADDPTGRQIASLPVLDGSIFDQIAGDPGFDREMRIGTQRLFYRNNEGIWVSPAGTPQTTIVTADVPFNPDPGIEDNHVTIPIESTAPFTGRAVPWIRIGEQYLQVLHWQVEPGPLMWVPRTGYGAMMGPIEANAAVSIIDSVSNLYVTGRYDAPGNPERVRPQAIDSEVVMVVRSATGVAIHEQIVQDGRFSRTGATTRGVRELADFDQPLVSIAFETEDLNAKPGRLQAYTLTDPDVADLAGEFMIVTTEITWPVWGQLPRRRCHAAQVRPADVTDTWLTDLR